MCLWHGKANPSEGNLVLWKVRRGKDWQDWGGSHFSEKATLQWHELLQSHGIWIPERVVKMGRVKYHKLRHRGTNENNSFNWKMAYILGAQATSNGIKGIGSAYHNKQTIFPRKQHPPSEDLIQWVWGLNPCLSAFFLTHVTYKFFTNEFHIIPTWFLRGLNYVVQDVSRNGLRAQRSRIMLGGKGTWKWITHRKRSNQDMMWSDKAHRPFSKFPAHSHSCSNLQWFLTTKISL